MLNPPHTRNSLEWWLLFIFNSANWATRHTYVCLVFAIEFVTLKVEFITFAVELIAFVIEFGPFAFEFIDFAVEFICFTLPRIFTFAHKFIHNKIGSCNKHKKDVAAAYILAEVQLL